MSILGIDLGVRSIHIADEQHCHTIRIKKSDNRHTELSALINELVRLYPDAYVFVEEPVVAGARNLRTSLQMAQVLGAILSNYDGIAVPVPQWKKAVVGKGNVNKEAVKTFMQTQPEYKYTGDNQDWIDAMCIRMYGLQTLEQ